MPVKSRPRVLHVTACYSGGVASAIDTIARELPGATHHLLWASGDAPPADLFVSDQEFQNRPWAAVKAIRSAVETLKPDVIHAHSSWGGVYARSFKSSVPVIYEPHCYKFDDESSPRLLRLAYRQAEKLLTRRTAATVVLSPHERRLATELDPTMRIEQISNAASALPTPEFPSTSFQPSSTVMMIGRLCPQKDPEFFGEVAERVRTSIPDAEFRWIGDGDERLKHKLQESGVHVTGWVQGTALTRELSSPGVYFHSARYEGFPLSLLDAAAFEHPIIARRIPAFEGLDIPGSSSAGACADLIVSEMRAAANTSAACDAAKRLKSPDRLEQQRDTLTSLYQRLSFGEQKTT